MIAAWGISCEIDLIWMSLDLTDDQSGMAWCRQAISHYMNQCWPRSLPPYGISRPQWVNLYCIFCRVCISATSYICKPQSHYSLPQTPLTLFSTIFRPTLNACHARRSTPSCSRYCWNTSQVPTSVGSVAKRHTSFSCSTDYCSSSRQTRPIRTRMRTWSGAGVQPLNHWASYDGATSNWSTYIAWHSAK